MFYSGDGNNSDTAKVTTSLGIGAQFHFEIESILDSEEGTLTQAISELETKNKSYADKIEKIDDSLARQREVLMDKFIAMESALAKMKNIQSSLDELMAAGKEK